MPKKDTTHSKTAKTRGRTPRNLVLDAELKIAQARQLKDTLTKFLSRKQLTIDASRVEKIDTSTLQLLTAFVTEAGDRSAKIRWLSPSPALLNAAGILGLTQHLKLPQKPHTTEFPAKGEYGDGN